tara:strand:- start:19019 stop:19960 length:942 start_codon:yes stop_codon:yes gene_type:complete
MKNYALIGSGGYISSRHLQAIKNTGGNLIVSFDIKEPSQNIEDLFPNSIFFNNFNEFKKHIADIKGSSKEIDFICICSPNHLHFEHITYGLKNNMNVICEKPLVLKPDHLNELDDLEKISGNRVFSILQLRLHPAIINLKDSIRNKANKDIYKVDLSYFSSRDASYLKSWKGSNDKSGGIVTNIGIHYFDLLGYLFGKIKKNIVHHRKEDCATGYLEFNNAKVSWIISINLQHMPKNLSKEQKTYRSIRINDQEIDFSIVGNDLHEESYKNIIRKSGFGIAEARPSIELVNDIRNNKIIPSVGSKHRYYGNIE